jgi:7-cyano-7-deazaguanine reductase
MTNESIYKNLTMLGSESMAPESPQKASLEKVRNPQAGTKFNVRFVVPEFTSLCPMTGQPDFAHLVIDYVPKDWLVESKSLKLYLTSFRNHGAFHEDCTVSSMAKNWWLLVSSWGNPN